MWVLVRFGLGDLECAINLRNSQPKYFESVGSGVLQPDWARE